MASNPELEAIEFKIKILDNILQEARAKGDERWHEPARQIELLNQRRAEIIKAETEIAPSIIQAKIGRMGAKTHG